MTTPPRLTLSELAFLLGFLFAAGAFGFGLLLDRFPSEAWVAVPSGAFIAGLACWRKQ